MRRFSFLFFFVVLVFHSCNTLPDVGIKSLGFGNEVSLLQNMLFEFDDELVFDGDLNQWESTPYIDFEPKIEGKFKWIGRKELVFSPAKPLRFAQDYKAIPSDRLLKRKKGKVEIEKEVIRFHTPYLKIDDAQVFFTKNTAHQKEARVLLQLNGKYDAHTIKNEIVIKKGNQIVDYKLLPAENSNNLVLALATIPTEKGGELTAEIKGVKENPNKFKENLSVAINVLPTAVLEVIKIETSFKKLKGYAFVKTNQKIEVAQIEKNLSIEPKVNYSIETNDQGFVIKGDFNQEDLYTIKIKKEIVGALGGKMDEDFEGEAYFGRVNPYLEFTNKKAQYISSLGNKNIGINIVNIPKVNVTLSKIYENNLLPFLRGNRRSYYQEDGVEYYYDDDAELYGDKLYEKKIETENLPRKQGVSMLNLPLPDQSQRRGIYFISVDSEDEYYNKIQKVISVSDIGLIAKLSHNQEDMIVFANSIMEAKPLSGIEVKLISSSNQEMAKGISDKNGVVVFKEIKKKSPNTAVAMVTATNTADFNYLLFDDTAIETSKFDVAGKQFNEANLDAFIYGDREIYRPGETIHFNTVVRNNDWQTPSNIPLKIKVKQPNGKEISSLLTQTNDFGAVMHDVKLERAALTGFYHIDILTGNDVLIGSKTISVEDFMPDRIKVTLDAPEKIDATQKAIIRLQANNLFGPPATDNKYEMEYSLKRKTFAPKGFEGFVFGLTTDIKFENELRNGLTDSKGQAVQEFSLPNDLINKGLLEAKVLASVFDETGRPVYRQKTVDIFTQKQFLGIKLPGYFVGTNIPLSYQVIALTPDAKPAIGKADVELYLLDYQTVLEKTEEGGLRYVSKKKEKLMKSEEVNFSGKIISQTFVPKISGEYEIRIKPTDADSYVSANFYAYGYGNKASFEVDTDGEIQIETNQENYETGNKVKAIFKTPFDGKLLVTIENQGIIEYRQLETSNKSAEISIDLTEKHLPNIYLTATLVRPMNQPELPLMSAHGMASIKVDDPKRRLPIVINAAEKSRSKTKQKIEIRTSPNTELTVAVVDEGILQLKNTETPKINEYFYQKRALGVASYDLYPLLLPEIQLNQKSSTGGDGGLGKRINPLANGRAELVAKWSGQLKSDAYGKASFEFEIPEFLGSVRIMVVAYNGQNFGSEEQKMVVADPVGISVGLPAFLSPNDKVKVPITFFNTTDQVQEVKASAQAEGQLLAGNLSETTFRIEPGKEKFVEMDVSGKAAIGLGKLKILAKTADETFSKTTEISIRPAGSLQKSGSSGILTKDQEKTFSTPQEFIAGSYNAKIYVGNSPMMQFGFRLENLLEYPYGCIEQTISKAFPQLYFDELAQAINGDLEISESGASELNPQYNVNAAIEKIEAMQLYNGGLPYWQGSQDDYWWGSAYALHFLQEAQKSGFMVSKDVIKNLTYYLTNRTNEEESKETIWVNQNNQLKKTERLKTEFIYSLYVLSLGDDPNVSAMNQYKADLSKLSNDQRFLLACAYKQIGDDATFNAILPKSFVRESYDRMLLGSFSSPIRSMALVLNSLAETDPSNSQIAGLSQSLNSILSNRANSLNTQELAFSMMAMSKLLKNRKSNGKAEIFADGKLVKTVTGKGEWIDLTKYPNGVSVKTSQDNLYYYYESEGIRKDNKFVAEDKNLKVRRTYLTRTGQPITTPTFTQNQLIVVKLTINTIGLAYNADNVVITDMLPAGFEIENPRLVEDRDLPWIKDAATPDYFDIRDDRINYFVNADATERNYYYLVRVVSKGSFIQGPVSADAMYNANIRSYWGGGTVTVK